MVGELVLVVLTMALASAQQPPRDAAAAGTRAGTATISGIVITDDADKKPVRRARVSIMEQERRGGMTIITDDAGRFTFRNVPAGRYLLTPFKNAWVGTSFGARRPGRSGTPITIADGQQVDKLTLRMARGGVITGTVTDESGRPLARTMVTPFRYVFQGATRTLVPSGSTATSDDRGVYRIYGLQPGQYLVAARNPLPGSSPIAGSEIRQTTDADIQRALAVGSGGRPGRAQPHQEDRGTTVTYAPMFYPGTSTASQATVISIAPGDERTGIDFPVSLVPTARVEGTVVDPEGAVAANSSVNLITSEISMPGLGFETFRIGRTTAEGRFTFAGVIPGKYTVVSRATPARDRAAAAGRPGEMTTPALWAMADVVVDGQPISGLTLTLQSGFIVSGRLQFSGTLPPPDITRIRVQLMPVNTPGQVNVGVPPAQAAADGTFTIKGVAPGMYRVSAMIPGARPDSPGWTLASAIVDGREVLDAPYELRQSVQDAVLTFRDQVGELSGTLQDPAGRPAPDYYIVVFSADRAHWTPQSRRIRAMRPSAEGRFTVRNLPAGEYLVSAVTDIEDGEWYDPSMLQQLAAVSMKLTLAEGEKKVQDIQVGASR